MSRPPTHHLRAATAADDEQLLRLWGSLFDEDDADPRPTWEARAREWFAHLVEDQGSAHFPVVEVDGEVVATAIGTLELGVPNPHCRRGRTVRLANVVTAPEHRGHGFGSLLVRDLVGWARAVDADRVDLSATPEGQRIYAEAGFVLTTAPRMKLVL